jgi:hypothetical protein
VHCTVNLGEDPFRFPPPAAGFECFVSACAVHEGEDDDDDDEQEARGAAAADGAPGAADGRLAVGTRVAYAGFSGCTIGSVNDDGTYTINVPGVANQNNVPRDRLRALGPGEGTGFGYAPGVPPAPGTLGTGLFGPAPGVPPAPGTLGTGLFGPAPGVPAAPGVAVAAPPAAAGGGDGLSPRGGLGGSVGGHYGLCEPVQYVAEHGGRFSWQVAWAGGARHEAAPWSAPMARRVWCYCRAPLWPVATACLAGLVAGRTSLCRGRCLWKARLCSTSRATEATLG